MRKPPNTPTRPPTGAGTPTPGPSSPPATSSGASGGDAANPYHPYPSHPETIEDFVRQVLAVARDSQVRLAAAALRERGLDRKIMLMVLAYRTEPGAFGPFREWRNKVWRVVVLSNPEADRAVRDAVGWKESEPV